MPSSTFSGVPIEPFLSRARKAMNSGPEVSGGRGKAEATDLEGMIRARLKPVSRSWWRRV
jgi:hypothetical protein